jgi:hypothetical protein
LSNLTLTLTLACRIGSDQSDLDRKMNDEQR